MTKNNNGGQKMKCIKLFTVCLVIMILIFSFGLSANAACSRDSVEKLLLLTKVDQLMNQMYDQIKPMVLQQFRQMNLTKDQSQIIDKYMGKMFDVMKSEMSWDKIKDDFIQIYESVYSEEEIQDLIKFYQTPTGQKLIEKTPIVIQQSMAINQKYVMNIMPQIQEIAMELTEEISHSSK